MASTFSLSRMAIRAANGSFPAAYLALSLMTAASAGTAMAADYIPGEVLVKYKTGALRTRAAMNQMYDSIGAQGVRRYRGTMAGFEHIYLGEKVKVEDAIAELRKDNAVEFVQPNYVLHAFHADAADASAFEATDFSAQPPGAGKPCWLPWLPYPEGCGQTPPPSNGRPELNPAPSDVQPPMADPDLKELYGMQKIGAVEAWNSRQPTIKALGSKTIIVADIDTGIDYNHEDLAFNVWRNKKPGPKGDVVGYDFIHNDGLPFDDQGHGSHTSGTIGATGGNGKGVSGVSQRVSIMALKFLSSSGSGTTASAIRAIDYAIEHGAKVLSNSWGGRGEDGNKALYESIERAKAKGVLFVAAAGNDGADNDDKDKASYPAAFDNDNLIAVAATDSNDAMASFSNYGAKSVHLGAPGVKIYSTIPGNKYRAASGTSMACPHVAGAAALLWSKHPTWTYKQIKTALLKSVDQVPSLAGKTITGGRLNVLKALRSKE